MEADCLSSELGDGDSDNLSVAYDSAAWAACEAAAGYDCLIAVFCGREDAYELDAELAVDDAVFVRRGGGKGGGTLEREDGPDASWLSLAIGSVRLRESDGIGSRSISESVLAGDKRRGGSGGAGLRRIASCDGVGPLDTEESELSVGFAAVRNEDGFEGLVGGTRGFVAMLIAG